MTISSYLTLDDGTLVDFEQAEDFVHLHVHAGQRVEPHTRPLVLTLTADDARQFGMHLAAFLANHNVIGWAQQAHALGAAHDCSEWGRPGGRCALCGGSL